MLRRRLLTIRLAAGASLVVCLVSSLVLAAAVCGSLPRTAPGAVRILCWTPYYSNPPKVRVYSKIKGAKAINVTWRGRTLQAEHSGNVFGAYFSVSRSRFQQSKRRGTIGKVKLGATLRNGQRVHRSGEAKTCVIF